MPSPLPYFHFWVKDYLSSSTTRRMSLAARGLFVDLLSFQWEDGFIPDDIEEIALMVGIQRADVAKVWPKVRQSFVADDECRLRNPRLADERERAFAKSEKLSENGSKGGRPKKPKETKSFSDGKADAFQLESNCKAKPEPEPYIGDKSPSVPPKRAKRENSAFDPVKRVLVQVHERIPDFPEPQNGDILPHLKPDQPIPGIIKDYGEAKAVELFVFAWEHWETKPTWPSVFRNRGQLAAQIEGNVKLEVFRPTRQPGEARELAR